ncbi:PHB depolymerase family esterase [uncultured Paracoccus sp.]|uniref:extracellular catalytic domain type 1 short-chain-length polyhydroxyalkanoate depolymerase n=1 Tax=uncultured Paracoccus sp. TaxID=189685 RepID=UPI002603626E|nr:PHB depolymerase family esterase [uncultured Paracoccus sp.]
MNHDFALAMRQATDLVRAGNAAAATDLILASLGGQTSGTTGAQPMARPAFASLPTYVSVPTDLTGPTPTPSPARAEKPDRKRRRGKIGRNLRDTLAGLARAKPQPGRTDEARLPPLPEGARFDSGTFTCAAGSRDYRAYVPDLGDAPPAGLILMLHGCTQSPVDFAAGTDMNRLAEEQRLIVLYPAQSRGANMKSCWNWFAPGDQARGAGEPAILAGLTEKFVAQHDVPRDRVFVAGLSAGAAMAVILGQSHGDLFAAVGAHSGLPYRAATDVPSAFAAMAGTPAPGQDQPGTVRDIPTIVFHGTADRTVAPVNGRRIADQPGTAGPEIIDKGERNGRSYSRAVIAAPDGRAAVEYWQVDGLGHAWSGGSPAGSYTDPVGPDASAEMVRFFLEVAGPRH